MVSHAGKNSEIVEANRYKNFKFNSLVFPCDKLSSCVDTKILKLRSRNFLLFSREMFFYTVNKMSLLYSKYKFLNEIDTEIFKHCRTDIFVKEKLFWAVKNLSQGDLNLIKF